MLFLYPRKSNFLWPQKFDISISISTPQDNVKRWKVQFDLMAKNVFPLHVNFWLVPIQNLQSCCNIICITFFLHSDDVTDSMSNLKLNPHTGCSIKIQSHSFNHTCSQDRNPSNFKTTFICYYTELSFEVYTSFLGQLA